MIRSKIGFLLIALTLSVQYSNAQLLTIPETVKSYPFVIKELNVISNREQLSGLMERLYLQKKSGDQKINILHIGDSHLQADFMTNVIRTTLQKEFGNSGRGLIVPYRIAKTNEPFNYKTSSTYLWQNKRCVFPNQPLPIGIGGVTISSNDSCAAFTVFAKNDSLLNYSFNKVTLFYQKDSTSYNFALIDSLGNRLGAIIKDTINNQAFTSSVSFPTFTNKITVQLMKGEEQNKHATIYGVLLENGNPGIGYHTIGVNGAQYLHYSGAKYFTEQTKALKPDLIIVSLGTNEAYALNFKQEQFYADIQLLYCKLKQENPDVPFLFTTPTCSYRRKKPNPRLPLAAKTIIQFSNDNKLSYWDLQGATGGEGSAVNWKKNRLLRPDGVHYSKDGYELQGTLFCQAFFNSFNAYVANRPQ
jgi:lysophospholipase L1-like esterase